jgi:hypothetical protein
MIKITSISTIASLIILFSCAGNNEAKPVEQKDTATTSHDQHAAVTGDYAADVNAGIIKEDTMKGSPVRTATGTVGNTQVQITYGSPGVKSRIIWGGLVAYDKVWATGAHKATKVNFSKAVTIAGKQLAAGDYAFFTIPGKEKWILILNKNFEQHLADDYQEGEDVVRVEVVPKVGENILQRLTYSINKQSDTGGAITMQWEKVEVGLLFIVQ